MDGLEEWNVLAGDSLAALSTLSFFKKGNELRCHQLLAKKQALPTKKCHLPPRREAANCPQRRVACHHILKMAVLLSFSQSEQACVQTNEGKTVHVQYGFY